MPEKETLERTLFLKKHPDIHQPDDPAESAGKRKQDVYSRGDPFCEIIFTVLGLVKCGDLLSKDGKDSLGGIARLEGGKERMGGQIPLGLTLVGF